MTELEGQCAIGLDWRERGTCFSEEFATRLEATLARARNPAAGRPIREQLLALADQFQIKTRSDKKLQGSYQPDADLAKRGVFGKLDSDLGNLAKKELAERFKPEGPAGSDTWLSNWNIQDVLTQYQRRFKFFHALEPVMYDFMDYDNDLRNFNPEEIRARGITCVACVLNTDTSKGPGKHWVSMFLDMRHERKTLEFFNSSGKGPTTRVNAHLAELAKRVGAEFYHTAGREHQYSNSECGMYSLYYVWHRLAESLPLEMSEAEGRAARFAVKSRIPDSDAYAFRAKVFLVCESCES